MQSIPDILAHIEFYYEWIFESPKMYCRDANDLHSQLLLLDDLREFILGNAPPGGPIPRKGYNCFYDDKYPNKSALCTIVSDACKRFRTNPNDERVYQAVIESWKEYLASAHRTTYTKADTDLRASV